MNGTPGNLVEKTPPPLLGFNNNVRHRGQVFHIQTEDSGVRHSRIMTHLFADGGRIVQTARTEYSEHLGRDDMVEIVRRMMKEQHKAMFVRLRAGELDEEIEQACGPLPQPPAERSIAPKGQKTANGASGSAQEESSVPPPRQRSLSNPSLRRVAPSVPPPAPGSLDFEVESLADETDLAERAAAIAAERAGRAVSGDDARYAQSRPTAIFGDIPQPGSSIFGERNVSEKSLDEVILSYLAEDLEES